GAAISANGKGGAARESHDDGGWTTVSPTPVSAREKKKATLPSLSSSSAAQTAGADAADPWSKAVEARQQRKLAAKTVGAPDRARQAQSVAGPRRQHKARKGGPANGDVDIAAGAGHDGDDNDDSSDSDGAAHHALAIRDQKALERAFAGDDVAAAFAAEKEAV